jgi:hypothetical protein
MRRAWAVLLLSCFGCGDEAVAPGPGVVLADMQAAMKAGRWEIVYDHLPEFVRVKWTTRLLALCAVQAPTEVARDDLRRIAEPVLSRVGEPSAERALESAIKEAPDRRALFAALATWMRKHDMQVDVPEPPTQRRRVRLIDWLAEPGEWKVTSIRDAGSHLDGPRKSAVVQMWDGTHMKEDEAGFLLFHYRSEGRWAVWPWRRDPPEPD